MSEIKFKKVEIEHLSTANVVHIVVHEDSETEPGTDTEVINSWMEWTTALDLREALNKIFEGY